MHLHTTIDEIFVSILSKDYIFSDAFPKIFCGRQSEEYAQYYSSLKFLFFEPIWEKG